MDRAFAVSDASGHDSCGHGWWHRSVAGQQRWAAAEGADATESWDADASRAAGARGHQGRVGHGRGSQQTRNLCSVFCLHSTYFATEDATWRGHARDDWSVVEDDGTMQERREDKGHWLYLSTSMYSLFVFSWIQSGLLLQGLAIQVWLAICGTTDEWGGSCAFRQLAAVAGIWCTVQLHQLLCIVDFVCRYTPRTTWAWNEKNRDTFAWFLQTCRLETSGTCTSFYKTRELSPLAPQKANWTGADPCRSFVDFFCSKKLIDIIQQV